MKKMKKIQKLINQCWELVENDKIDGSTLVSLDDCQEELTEAKYVKLKLCEVNRSTKIKIDKPFKIKGIKGKYIAEIRNIINNRGNWDKEICFVKIE